MTEKHKSRRGVLKSMGTAFAGATGIVAVASNPVSAQKQHTATIRPNGSPSSYRIVVSDPNANFGSIEGGDNINHRSSSTVLSGSVDPTFSPKYDRIFYNGVINDIRGPVDVYEDGDRVYDS